MIGFRRRIEKLEAKMAVRSAQEPEEFVIVQVETREEAVASLELDEAIR